MSRSLYQWCAKHQTLVNTFIWLLLPGGCSNVYFSPSYLLCHHLWCEAKFDKGNFSSCVTYCVSSDILSSLDDLFTLTGCKPISCLVKFSWSAVVINNSHAFNKYKEKFFVTQFNSVPRGYFPFTWRKSNLWMENEKVCTISLLWKLQKINMGSQCISVLFKVGLACDKCLNAMITADSKC